MLRVLRDRRGLPTQMRKSSPNPNSYDRTNPVRIHQGLVNDTLQTQTTGRRGSQENNQGEEIRVETADIQFSVPRSDRVTIYKPQPRAPITFVCWKWHQPGYRTPYTAEHVNVWAAMIKRYYKKPHRLLCITDNPTGIDCETFPLWKDLDTARNPSGAHLPSCYRRLKIFSPLVTSELDIGEGDEVFSMDLDIVICTNIEMLIQKYADESFVGWKGVGTHNPVVYNGSLFKFRAGHVNFLWDEFNFKTSPHEAIKAKYFGSDQGWLSYRLRGTAPGWTAGTDGVLSYTSNLHAARMRSRAHLPSNARIICFNGKRKPWEKEVQQNSPWITTHWRL